jgi:hypothetical protein
MMSLGMFMRASVVTGGLAATALLSGGTAFAATSTTATSPASICTVTALYGNTPINQSATTASPVVGHLTKGTRNHSACNTTVGGGYSACFADSNVWILVFFPTTGYVKSACVKGEIIG